MMAAKKWVLVVDQETELSLALERLTKASGTNLHFVWAEKSQDVCRKVSLQAFDLTILNVLDPVELREMLEFFTNVGSEFRPRKNIVITGEKTQEIKEDERTLCLPKPFSDDALKNAMEVCLNGKKETKSQAKVDVNFLLPFIEGVVHVLKMSANITSEREDFFIRTASQASGDISGVVLLESEKYKGSFSISFGKSCFLAVVNNMLGESNTELTPEISDAAAEICNQTFGYAKEKLNSSGHTLKSAIPTVITGKGHSVKHVVEGACLAVRFKTPSGPFVVEAVVRPTEA